MSELTLKEVVASVSKIRQMEQTGLRENDSFTLAFHLVKIYKLSACLAESIKAIKSILLERKIDKMMFWEDELKVMLGNKNSTSVIDIKKVYEFAVQNKLENEFWKACTLVESKIENKLLQSSVLLNKKKSPGEKDGELKIEKITKDDKLLNV